MENIIFTIQGSASEPYKTTFMKNGRNITATCTCMGAIMGLACKHRIGILTGNVKKFKIVSNNISQIKTIQSWLPNSDVENTLNNVIKAEKHLDEAKENLKNAKKHLSEALTD